MIRGILIRLVVLGVLVTGACCSRCSDEESSSDSDGAVGAGDLDADTDTDTDSDCTSGETRCNGQVLQIYQNNRWIDLENCPNL